MLSGTSLPYVAIAWSVVNSIYFKMVRQIGPIEHYDCV